MPAALVHFKIINGDIYCSSVISNKRNLEISDSTCSSHMTNAKAKEADINTKGDEV
jgi:hypothetical protein